MTTARALVLGLVTLAGCQSATRSVDAAPAKIATQTATVAAAVVAARPAASPSKKPLKVALTVKEVAGVGATDYPVSAVIPLPQGRFQDTALLTLSDASGAVIPAQFEVLNRHWAKDNSIRHVLAHFQSTVSARGDTAVILDESGKNTGPAHPIVLTETPGDITVDTGALKLKITKKPFSISTPSGPLTAELVTAEKTKERSFDATDVTVKIEERGPLRALIRAESPAFLTAPGKVRHGWAVRIYAYAGKPFVQVDYQLQNSPKNETWGAVMYFDSLVLSVPSGRAAKPTTVKADNLEKDPLDLAPAVVTTPSVQATVRHFWEMWPTALSVDARGVVSAELFPAWGTRRFQGKPSPLGLHWLDDMQHTVKETMFRFGDPAGFDALAATFAFHPVVIVPVSWYADTEVTLDMGGVFPRREKVGDSDLRKPRYDTYHHGDRPLPLRFGWDNFGIDLYRKEAPSNAGNWPASASRCFLTEDPADFWAAEDFAMGELNVRPEWLAQYDYARDFEKIAPDENPYGGYSWRKFTGNGTTPEPKYRPGSGQETKPHDDEHAWFYSIEEGYYCSGNPWIRDYYEFVGQFRRTRLHQKDPYPDMSSRAVGHSISHALQAYRITGDKELLKLAGLYFTDIVGANIDPATGFYKTQPEAVFQLGYLAHAMITYLEELPERDPAVLKLLGGLVHWNMTHGNWGYYTEPGKTAEKSDLTAMTFADPQSWYGIWMNDRAALANVEQFITQGINGGQRPPIDLTDWTGDFNGRICAAAIKLLHE